MTTKETKTYPEPLVTKKTRKQHKGFVERNPGIPVAPGLNMQDVPRHMIMQHMKKIENFQKEKFNEKYAGMGGNQSY